MITIRGAVVALPLTNFVKGAAYRRRLRKSISMPFCGRPKRIPAASYGHDLLSFDGAGSRAISWIRHHLIARIDAS